MFTLGLENAADSTPLSIRGYTLDYTFDATELAFVRADQLAAFGGDPVEFTPPNGDGAVGRTTACSSSTLVVCPGRQPALSGTSRCRRQVQIRATQKACHVGVALQDRLKS